MESIYILQTQSKLCHSEGKSKRKVTANCANCKRLRLLEKTLTKVSDEMKRLEYILDATNQKRLRKDKQVKRAWGYAVVIKGQLYKALDYYQPTLLVYHYNGPRKEIDPTWTKNSRKVWTACNNAKKVACVGGNSSLEAKS